MKLAVLTLALFIGGHSFTIPLLFGGISIGKTANNEVAVGIQRGVNVLGNGFDADTNFVIGNGTFNANDANSVLVNGRKSGPRTSLGVGKDGFNLGGDVVVEEEPKDQPSQHLTCPPSPWFANRDAIFFAEKKVEAKVIVVCEWTRHNDMY